MRGRANPPVEGKAGEPLREHDQAHVRQPADVEQLLPVDVGRYGAGRVGQGKGSDPRPPCAESADQAVQRRLHQQRHRPGRPDGVQEAGRRTLGPPPEPPELGLLALAAEDADQAAAPGRVLEQAGHRGEVAHPATPLPVRLAAAPCLSRRCRTSTATC